MFDLDGSRLRSTRSLPLSTASWLPVGVERAYDFPRAFAGCRHRSAFPLLVGVGGGI
jgi:hypothetical protein